jgi:hypothetical protein
MTIRTVRNVLGELVALLDVVDASSRGKAVRVLSAFLEPYEQAATAAFFRKATPRKEIGAGWTGQSVGDVLPTLQAYHRLLDRVGSKSAKEVGVFVKFLEPYKGSGLAALISAAQESLTAPTHGKRNAASPTANEVVVADYVARLKPALGSDHEFESIFGQLKGDKAVRRQEMAEIAKRIMPFPPSNLDRKRILGAIQSLHRSAKGFDRKLKAMSGRSAA